MSEKFVPYANEADALGIGNLEVENRLDRVVLMGDVVLTKDKTGLALALALQTLIDDVVNALQAEAQLPDAVEITPPDSVDNPFA
jgi:hypothetical protein